ncbi:MAG: hypothetical protein E6370_11260 [Clostridiales bacterium]|nr:hypothetical protein [Clostridiales bacterium]MDU6974890.1 hypothetical protein [Clostridiales bacterium]
MDTLDKAVIEIHLCAIERFLNGIEVFAESDFEDVVQARLAEVNKCLEEVRSILNKIN